MGYVTRARAVLCAVMLSVAFGVSADKPEGIALAGKWRFSNGPEFPGARGDLIADLKGRLRDAATSTQQPPTCDGIYLIADYLQDSGPWRVHQGTMKSGVWTVDFGQMDSAFLEHGTSLFGRPSALILKLRAKEAGYRLKVSIGSHFQGFQRTLTELDGTEQTLSIPAPPKDWAHSGVENDGVARYPLRLSGFLLERGNAPKGVAQVEFKELRCETKLAADECVTMLARVKETGRQEGRRKLDAVCTAWNLTDRELNGALTLVVRNWEQQELARQTTPWTLPPEGAQREQVCTVSIPDMLHFAEAEFTFAAEGVTPSVCRGTYAAPLDDTGDATLRPESPWGMGVYLYRYGDSPGGCAEMDRAAAMAQAAGVKWSREEFGWAGIEREKGKYYFDFMDKVVDTAAKHAISVYGLLSYWSNFTQPYTQQGIDDFCVWARAVVGHFKGRVKHWEIYNEPNIFFWSGPKELYPVLVKKCHAAIKEANPEAIVLAVSTSGIDKGFIKKCVEAGAPFDVLTIHPYRTGLVEESFMSELRETAKLVHNRPVWITEMGWSTQLRGTDESSQAKLLARSYLSAVASGACQNISWYDFRNDGTDPFYNEANFGVIRSDMTPKPAYRALATVCRTLSQGTPKLRNDFGKAVYVLETGDATAVWSAGRDCEVRCKASSGTPRLVNLMGEELPVRQEGDTFTLALHADCPVFVNNATIKPLEPAVVSVPGNGSDVIRF